MKHSASPLRVFTAQAPLQAYHGTTDLAAFTHGMPPAATCHWYTKVPWKKHDRWMDGGPHLEEGIPYANIIWEALGLRNRAQHTEAISQWAQEIRTHEQLATQCGMLFVTDRREDAERYGKYIEIDLASPFVLDVLDDPHVRTHNGWIVLLKAHAPIPMIS